MWLVFFLISQGAFSAHKLTHFEETDHQEECFICDVISSDFCELSKQSIPFIAFKNHSIHGPKSFIFVKKNLYSPLLPRPPPKHIL